MFEALFSGGKSRREAEALLFAVSTASRRPGFFGPERVSDDLDGRLGILTLHACLTLMRLKREAEAAALAQTFTDILFRHIDAGLREDGVGDLSVPRRMRKIAAQFYGRLQAYEAALAAGDKSALADALARNLRIEAFAVPLAAYVRDAHDCLQKEPAAALAEAGLWPNPPV